MFFLPGIVVTILTFPGVIVHEAAHRLFCDLAGVRVFEVCYFQVGSPAGYVVHERTTSLPASFLISIGPILVNTVLCMLLCFGPVVVLTLGEEPIPVVPTLMLWLGLAIGMQAFPSNADTRNFAESVKEYTGGGPGLRAAAAALRTMFLVANGLRIVGFDLLYAVSVAWLLPGLLLLHQG